MVHKGNCDGTKLVEKFTADIPPGNNKKSYAKKFEVFFKINTIKSTIKTSITELEYNGAITPETANILRTTTNTQSRKILFMLRLEILGFRTLNLIRNIPAYIKSTLIWLLKDMPLNLIKLLIGTLRSILKSYISSEYQKKNRQRKG